MAETTEQVGDERAVLARQAGRADPHSQFFRVSDIFLNEWDGDWSEPVQFRFEMSDHGLDLVFRRVDPPPP